MRAAWWWIDRWRKSTAYICMSLEEQGLYRNLLDALWLFDDHIIPDTPKALITASGGDPEAWSRSGENVLKWMERKGHGWTNSTALEVIGKTTSIRDARSKAGRAGAAKREANRQANPQANGDSKDNPPSPSPSPSMDPSVGRSTPSYPGASAEEAVKKNVDSLQLRLGALLTQLAEHENSRLMVPAWSKRVTSYQKDGRKIQGRADFRMIRSPERLEKSIGDAQWWLKELNGGRVVK
jgi:uncharacterized protein YdaU (DUF1376 family)